jgi:hypothetical protein
MKKFALITIATALSLNTQAFEDFVQDVSADETNIKGELSSDSTDMTISNSSNSISTSSDSDTMSFSATHYTTLNSGELFGIRIGIENESEDDEDSSETSVGIQYVKEATDSRNAFSYYLTYEKGDTDNGDDIGLGFSKELRSSDNLKLDGELSISSSLPINNGTYSGGNLFMVGAAGRYLIDPNFRLIGGLVISMLSDIKYDDGSIYSTDPSIGLIFSAAYEISKNVVLDGTYFTGGIDGSVSGSSSEVDVKSDFSGFSISLNINI